MPSGPTGRVGQIYANLIEQGDILRRAAQVPVGFPDIAGLVIAVGRIVRDPAVSRSPSALDQISAAAQPHQEQNWYAALGDREMVRAVKERPLGLGIGG